MGILDGSNGVGDSGASGNGGNSGDSIHSSVGVGGKNSIGFIPNIDDVDVSLFAAHQNRRDMATAKGEYGADSMFLKNFGY